MFISFRRATKFAAQNFGRNVWLSLATISMVFLMLISLNIIVVLNFITNSVVQTIEGRVDMSVYLKPSASDEMVKSARAYLAGLPEVEEVGIVDPEDALLRFQERHKNNPEIVSALGEIGSNPLGATLIIRAKSTSGYQAIMDALDNPAYKDIVLDKDFSNYEKLISRVQILSNKARMAGVALSLVFAVISFLIVSNSVRLAIYTHREEIGIMKLVGASNWFVSAPYLIEGFFVCLLSLFMIIAVMFPSLNLMEPQIASFFEGEAPSIVDYFFSNFFTIFGLEFLISLFLVLGSSLVAVKRYLRA
jgi:cell division transport system permease protein